MTDEQVNRFMSGVGKWDTHEREDCTACGQPDNNGYYNCYSAARSVATTPCLTEKHSTEDAFDAPTYTGPLTSSGTPCTPLPPGFTNSPSVGELTDKTACVEGERVGVEVQTLGGLPIRKALERYPDLGRHFELPPGPPLPAGFPSDEQPGDDGITETVLVGEMRKGLGLTPLQPAMILPTDSASRKAIPLFRGLVKYFPRALAAVAHLSFLANEKHNPGEPLHWSKNKSSDHLDACLRHMVDAGTIDPEFGLFNDVGLAWRALASLELFLEAQEQQ